MSRRLTGRSTPLPYPNIHRRHTMSTDTDRIRTLNDQLRRDLSGGKAVMTPGVAALGSEAVQRLLQTLAIFDDFCVANDPHGEHDFGVFDFDGVEVFFKIDYFD